MRDSDIAYYRVCWRIDAADMAACCPSGRRFASIDLAIAAARAWQGAPGHTRFVHGVAAVGTDGLAYVVATFDCKRLELGEAVTFSERAPGMRDGGKGESPISSQAT